MSLNSTLPYLVAFAVFGWLAWLLRENERAYRARSVGRRDGAPYLDRLRRRRKGRPAPVPAADPPAPRVPAGPIAVPVRAAKPTGTFAAGAEGEARVSAVLRSSGLPVLEDFLIESGTGYSQIDHIVHAGGRLVVIETKNLAGTLRGAGRAERWTQSRPGLEDRGFYSPLLQAEKQVTWLRALMPTTRVEIEVLVVLAGKAAPPPGAAEAVIALVELGTRLRSASSRPGNAVGADIAWAQVRHAISVTPQIQARVAHAIDHERRAGWTKAPDPDAVRGRQASGSR